MRLNILKSMLLSAAVVGFGLISTPFGASVAQAAPTSCASSIDVTSNVFVYKNSAPIRACSALTCPIVRFRADPTLLFKTRTYPGSCQILDKDGRNIARCPRQSAHDFSGGRCRCANAAGTLTRIVRRAAVSKSGSPEIFFKMGNKCVRVPDAGKCYGSTKGLCNTTLK